MVRRANKNNSLNTSKKIVQQNRNLIGAEFEMENDMKLAAKGIICSKKKVTTKKGELFISDHYFEVNGQKYWIESTIFLDTERARTFVNKKQEVQGSDASYNNWIIFFNPGDGQKSRKNIKSYVNRLKDAGYVVVEGKPAIDLFIEKLASMSKTIAFDENGFLRKPKLMYISIDKIKSNTANRKIDPNAKNNIKKSILKYGFLTQLNVIPETEGGVPTGNYILIEGDHRNHSVIDIVNELNIRFEDDTIPCSVVDWVTSEDARIVHELLVKLNTTTQPWVMENYVNSHYDASITCNDEDKRYSYDVLKWMYNTSTTNGYKKSKLFYILGPVSDSNKAASKWIDREMIKNGDYRISEAEFNNKMEPFTEKHLIPFIDWHINSHFYNPSNTTVADVFMKTLFYDYSRGIKNDDDVKSYVNAFKRVSTDSMPTTANEDEMKELMDLLDSKVAKTKTTKLNVKSPAKKVSKTKV